MQNFRPLPNAPYAVRAPASVLPFVRRVYALLTAAIGFAIVGAMVALYAGAPVELNAGSAGAISVPPVVAFEMQHPIVMLLAFVAAFFGASFARPIRGLNVAALFGYTFITGLFVAPSVFIAQAMASAGATMDASPVRDAFLLTGAAFTGLTTYCFFTKKDFSFLAASLTTGIWVVIGASLLAMFLHSSALSLAVASVSVLLFSGYILYDTSRILRAGEEDDAVGAALRLFLDVVNLFLALLRILSASRRSN
jgi:modulator of FtsH protease